MNYAIEQRQRLIDFLLNYYDSVSREEIKNYFGLEGATVTRDFQLYKRNHPSNTMMNKQSKRWVKLETFVRVYQ